MRTLLILLAATTALAQSAPQTRPSNTTENLRGVSAVSRQIAWASGAHGTYLRTMDAGRTWIPDQVPDAAALDFRAVVAFSAEEAFLMSAGPGDQSRIYHTADAGLHWQLQFTNTNPKGFFDSMVFWDRTHGIVLGDPIPDESGKLKFELLITVDGQTWTHVPPAQIPPAIEGEGAFAASNTSLAILSAFAPNKSPVILSGDTRSAKRSACRSRRTPCNLQSSAAPMGVLTTDAVTTTAQIIPASWRSPTLVIPASTTLVIPSAARDPGFASVTDAPVSTTPPAQPWKSGASAPRKSPEKEGASAPDPNIWFATGGKTARVFHSPDRGQTWQVFDTPIVHGPDSAGIFSIAFLDATHGVIAGGDYKHPDQDGPNLAFTTDGGKTWTLSLIYPQSYYSAVAYDRKSNKSETQSRLFLIGPKFIYDFRPPKNPTRISPPKKSGIEFNAVSPYPEGGALVVGPKGSTATIP
jgi:photosystem II stability/assembly factor-like uncharacterized protein